jgi:hypothetical protein
LEQMYLQLLKKVSVFDNPDAQLLSKLVAGMLEHSKSMTEDDLEALDAMFSELAKKASPKAIVNAARPHMSDQKLSSPVLPKNCVFFQEYGNGKAVVGIEVEKGRHDVIFGDKGQTVYKKVGYPAMLFWFSFFNEKAEASVVAVKDSIIKASTELYRFPFSNVYQSGSICWPSLSRNRIQDLHQLATLPYLFLGAPKNMDLYENIEKINLRELLDSLQNQDFDDEKLVPHGKTISDLLN